MLDVVTVVEQQEVVQPSVVTRSPSRVFEVALQETQPEAQQKSRQKDSEQKRWRCRQQHDPHGHGYRHISSCSGEAYSLVSPINRAMVSKVSLAPIRLRNPKQ